MRQRSRVYTGTGAWMLISSVWDEAATHCSVLAIAWHPNNPSCIFHIRWFHCNVTAMDSLFNSGGLNDKLVKMQLN